MRVLQIINSLKTGGAEKLLADSVPLYQKKNIKMDVLLLNGTATPIAQKLREESNGQVFSLGKGSVYNPMHLFKIMNYLRKYDVVHVHLFPALYWVALAKMLRFSKVKIVYTEHSTNNRRREKKFFKILDKIIYRSYSKIITIADEVDAQIKKHLQFNDSRFVQINNGIDTQLYHNAKPFPATDFFGNNDKIIIQVSSFRKPKDQQTVIKALTFLPENVKLLLVGSGPLESDCQALVQSLKLENRVIFLGIRMDVPRLLQTADVTILSSGYEGLSLSSIEAMASGKPFVASNAPGLREIVNGAGLLFETGNDRELASIIEKLLSDENFYREISSLCLQRAQNYDISKMIAGYLKVYHEVSNTSANENR